MNRIPEHAPFKTITKVFFTHKPEKLSVESGPPKVSLLHAQQEKSLIQTHSHSGKYSIWFRDTCLDSATVGGVQTTKWKNMK